MKGKKDVRWHDELRGNVLVEWSILQYSQLNEKQKLEAVEIFIDGFGHLMKFSKDREVTKALFLPALNPVYVYALLEEETVLGMVGLGTNKIRPIKLPIGICKEVFGNFKGTLICKQVNSVFQSQAVKGDTDLYIDVLASSQQARGKGVATRLLQHSFDLPGYENYYIDVLSKNVNAKRLYEKMGFLEYKKARFSFVAVMGFGYPIKMKK